MDKGLQSLDCSAGLKLWSGRPQYLAVLHVQGCGCGQRTAVGSVGCGGPFRAGLKVLSGGLVQDCWYMSGLDAEGMVTGVVRGKSLRV